MKRGPGLSDAHDFLDAHFKRSAMRAARGLANDGPGADSGAAPEDEADDFFEEDEVELSDEAGETLSKGKEHGSPSKQQQRAAALQRKATRKLGPDQDEGNDLPLRSQKTRKVIADHKFDPKKGGSL